MGPAIAVIETSSIALGYKILNDSLARAEVEIIEAASISPGKFLILLSGTQGNLESILRWVDGEYIVDKVLIESVHEKVLPGLYGLLKTPIAEALLVLETSTLSQGLFAANECLKKANIEVIEIRSGRGIGGRCVSFLTGKASDLKSVTKGLQKNIRHELIEKPHNKFLEYFNISGAKS